MAKTNIKEVDMQEVNKLVEKYDELKKDDNKLDLSSDEDLSIAIMNLISIEEHLFFSGSKTGKTQYFEVLDEIRKMRGDLMKLIIPEYEGEVWCISKHLLAASMRVMEYGTKHLKRGDKKLAEEMFLKAYGLYSLFWGLNMGLISADDVPSSTKSEK
jgi:hypothetical protein